MLTHVSLFSGIGGNELAAQWAGFQTVLMCEIDPFCRAVLNKHFPGIPIIEDVHDATRTRTNQLLANTLSFTGEERRDDKTDEAKSGSGRDNERRSGSVYCGEFRTSTDETDGVNRNPEGNPSDSFRQIQKRENAITRGIRGRGQAEQVITDSERLGRQAGAGDRIQSAQQITEGQEFNNFCDKRAGISGTQITLLTAGVPCQPASTAGKRRGKADDRWLWPEAIRVLAELQPAWAVFENPPGVLSLDEPNSEVKLAPATVIKEKDRDFYSAIYSREELIVFNGILDDIERAGYEVQPVLVSAASVGAFHLRERVFIIAHANDATSARQRRNGGAGLSFAEPAGFITGNIGDVFNPTIKGLPDWAGEEMGQPSPLTEFERPDGEFDTNPTGERLERGTGTSDREPDGFTRNGRGVQPKEREIECEFRLLADGFSERLVRPVRNRVSQLKAYGNALVPKQVYPIFKAIADLENL